MTYVQPGPRPVQRLAWLVAADFLEENRFFDAAEALRVFAEMTLGTCTIAAYNGSSLRVEIALAFHNPAAFDSVRNVFFGEAP